MNNSKLKLIVFFILMNSCSGSIYSELFSNISILFEEPEDVSIEKVKSIPFSSMQARIGKSRNSLIVLEEVKGDILKWTSSNNIKIYTKNNFIVRFTGLDNELENVDIDSRHPTISKNYNNEGITYTSFYTFDNPKLFRLPIKTKFNLVKEEELSILDKLINTKLYKEESLENLISWEFQNYYWVNDNNEIVKTIQNFTPRNPEIHLVITNEYKPSEMNSKGL
tara:strand:+ start:6295 stop:6963 length:669 start_codon:yes stop_codon:yes gene_type:complete